MIQEQTAKKPRDMLTIKALQVSTTIGVHAWEQRIKQPLVLDISIPMEFSACQDDLSQTLDYDELCQTVTDFLEQGTFQLIETVANQVAELIKKKFNLSDISVAVSKPLAIKNAQNIQVSVTR